MLLYIIGYSIFVLLNWYFLRCRTMSLLKRCGIPGPEPHLIFGNFFGKKTKKSLIDNQKDLIKKYGKVFGYYKGEKPIVMIADPELANLVMVKHFYNFIDRAEFFREIFPSYLMYGFLDSAKGQRWKNIRSLLSYAFTPNKLKAMNQMICDSIDSFIRKCDQMSADRQELDIFILLKRLSSEIIIKTAFGFSIDAQNDTQNKILKVFEEFPEIKPNYYILLITNCFRSLNILIKPILNLINTIAIKLSISTIGKSWSVATRMLEIRRADPSLRNNDFLQAMIDSYLSEKDIKNISNERLTSSTGDYKNHIITEHNTQHNPNRKKGIVLTENEIKANCIAFYMAGFDSTSTALSYAVHFLIKYPEQQEILRQEVKKMLDMEGVLDYTTVKGLVYMKCFLKEVMRFYPVFLSGSGRECLADYKYKDMVIPKGASIYLCTHFMQNDPEYWQEPDKFDPKRFCTQQKNEHNLGSYLAFGIGPRSCLGKQFAFYQMQLTLAHLLMKFKLERGPSTEMDKVHTIYKMLVTVPKNGSFVKLIKI